ncbi:MAG: hypothetical protein KAG53_06235 [Endozoicomonadaceae bacterium]|nr:hypothetical protein [Endozoicomonadaceae bacterium]
MLFVNIIREKCLATSTQDLPCGGLATSSQHESRFSSLIVSALNVRELLTFMLDLIKNHCFITNNNETHCTLCHKTVSQVNTNDYLSSTNCSIDFFHETNCPSLKNEQDTSSVQPSSISNQNERVGSNIQEVTRPQYQSETNIENLTATSVLPSKRFYLSSDEDIFTMEISDITPNQAAYSPALSNPQNKQQYDYNTTTSIEYPYYQTLEARKQSFLHWPLNKNQTGDSMALAGWVYSGHNDITFCYFCGGKAANWKEQRPWSQHLKMYPKCVYLKTYMSNEWLENSVTQLSLENQSYSSTSRLTPIVEHQTINSPPSKRKKEVG